MLNFSDELLPMRRGGRVPTPGGGGGGGALPSWVAALGLWEWYSIPNTALSSVAPNPAVGYGTPAAKINAWNGAALKRSGSVYIIGAAGGHTDYYGNEVDAIQLNAENPAWVQMKAPTPDNYIRDNTTFYLQEPDGKYRPSPGHTYYAAQFIDSLNKFVVVNSPGSGGGTGNPPDISAGHPYIDYATGWSFVFNMDTNDWETPEWMDLYQGPLGDYQACLCCKHPTTDDIYYCRGGSPGHLYKWIPSSGGGTWSVVSTEFWAASGYRAAAIDPTRSRFLIVGSYSGGVAASVWGLDGTTNVNPTFGGLGGGVLQLARYPGVIYDEGNDTFLVFYSSGANIECYRVDASTWSVDAPTITGTKPAAKSENTTLNAIQYVPELKGVAIANSYTGNVQFMRTAA